MIKDASATYDEATYAVWSQTVWTAAFYPDPIFVRHPPLYAFVAHAWQWVFPDTLPSLRFLSALATFGGIWALSKAQPNRWTPYLLAGSFVVVLFGVQVTMYGLAFLFGSLAVMWTGPKRRVALVLLALTHLFGVVPLALVAIHDACRATNVPGNRWFLTAKQPIPAVRAMLWALPAVLWVVASVIIEYTTQIPGDNYGPSRQAARGLFFLVDLDALQFHALTFLLGVATLVPAWNWPIKRQPFALTTAFLAAFLFLGPPFLRYAILIVPFAFMATPKLPAKTVAIAVAGTIAAIAVAASGFDPQLNNDLPGRVEWNEAAEAIPGLNVSVVSSPVITSIAYHMDAEVDGRHGPDELTLSGAWNGTLTRAPEADAWVVPFDQSRDGDVCFEGKTLRIYCS